MKQTAEPTTAMKRRERERRSNDALRLLPVVAPVVVGAFAALAAAGSEIAQSGHAVTLWLELATLLAAAIFVEAFPVPLRGVSAGGVSLAGRSSRPASVRRSTAIRIPAWSSATITPNTFRPGVPSSSRPDKTPKPIARCPNNSAPSQL